MIKSTPLLTQPLRMKIKVWEGYIQHGFSELAVEILMSGVTPFICKTHRLPNPFGNGRNPAAISSAIHANSHFLAILMCEDI